MRMIIDDDDGHDGSYPKSIEALIIGGTKNRKAQR